MTTIMKDLISISRAPGKTEVVAKIVSSRDIMDCPWHSMKAEHYALDGSCKCSNMRVVWSRYSPYTTSNPKHGDLWEKIEKAATVKGKLRSYSVVRIFLHTKPGTKTKQWCARVKVS